MLRLGHVAALVVVVAVLAVPGTGWAKRCSQDALCRTCFDSIVLDDSGNEPSCDGEALIDSRTAQNQRLNTRYQVCAIQAGGTGRQVPGKCRDIVARLNRCARKRSSASGAIWTDFKRQVRRQCGA